MIVPNLMVTDMGRSIGFYRDVIGMSVMMTVDADQVTDMSGQGDGADAVFAILDWNGAQLMLQTVASLAQDVGVFSVEDKPRPAGTVYFRGLDPKAIAGRASAAQVIKGPALSWYGMLEVYVRDPDGHIICAGAPEGEGPIAA